MAEQQIAAVEADVDVAGPNARPELDHIAVILAEAFDDDIVSIAEVEAIDVAALAAEQGIAARAAAQGIVARPAQHQIVATLPLQDAAIGIADDHIVTVAFFALQADS
ncbi:hypothetical protein D3C78_1328640 [compost metagenome]